MNLSLSTHVLLPYFLMAVLSAMALGIIFRNELAQRQGVERLLPFGGLFFAIAMAVFGADHLTDAKNVANVVPSWIPAHLFWTYLVGFALIAASFSIVLKKYASLAGILLGSMLLLFVATIHIPNLVAQPRDSVLWVTALRDLAFAATAFAFAAGQMRSPQTGETSSLVAFARMVIGAAALFFGVEDLLHPAIASGVPLDKVTPAWIPGHLLWSYVAGLVLIACGACILINVKVRLAATYLGIMILLLVVVIYLPILVSKPSDIENGLNYFVDTLAFSGAALILADAVSPILPSHSSTRPKA